MEPSERLTTRERQVIQLVGNGLENKEIAARLGISPKTVEFHVANLFSKFACSRRVELAVRAVVRGLIVPTET